ncbi:hypothetical protein BJ165DRAFT_1457682 [Panaeolus papilionaceus]|nr:hypothetical protein BJ165DRAFT_1457682 [Panaeolus papilionaceus]
MPEHRFGALFFHLFILILTYHTVNIYSSWNPLSLWILTAHINSSSSASTHVFSMSYCYRRGSSHLLRVLVFNLPVVNFLLVSHSLTQILVFFMVSNGYVTECNAHELGNNQPY